MGGFGALGGAAAAASLIAMATRAWERGDDPTAWALVVATGLAGALLAVYDSLRRRAARDCSASVEGPRRTSALGPFGRSPISAVAAAIDEPIAIVDAALTVTHLNPPAQEALGPAARVGSPFDPGSGLARALERARASGGVAVAVLRPIGEIEMSARVVDLGLEVGAAVVFSGAAQRDSVAAAPLPMFRRRSPAPDEPLVTLPITVVWTAATSIVPGEGRLIAFGCERLSGPRVFRTMSLDMLFDPGVEPEPDAVAFHGVDAETVKGSRDAAAAMNDIDGMLRGTILVGVDIDRVLDPLRRECAAAGRPDVADHPTLDLGLLAAAVDGGARDRDPARLREAFGVEPMPRHGVFAPVHEMAELTARVLTALGERGVTTLADARAQEEDQRTRVAQT